jgi:DnaJ-class molecular chaperone
MNERIKELAEQNVVRFDPDMDGEMETEEQGRWVRYDDLAKFAELIVKECARIARIYSEEGVEFNGGDAIKEHFGVEECVTCSGQGIVSNHSSDGSWDDRPCPDCGVEL